MIKLVENQITNEELQENTKNMFGNLVKAVVDLDKEIMAVFADLHADEEAFLLERGSKQTDLWGINIYPDKQGDERIEFDSMINLRPGDGNYSRSVEDEAIQKEILDIVNRLIKE